MPILDNEIQPSKVLLLIFVNEDEMSILFSFMQPWKEPSPTDKTEDGIAISVNDAHSLNE